MSKNQKQIKKVAKLLNSRETKEYLINVKANFDNGKVIRKQNVDVFEAQLLYSKLHRQKGFCNLEVYAHAYRRKTKSWLTELATLETDEDFFCFFRSVEI